MGGGTTVRKSCDHESCGREQYVWFPTNSSLHAEVRKHPWCKHCGVLKNISDDQPKKMGYWTNILARIRSEFQLTHVQTRLISVSLKNHDAFNDLYGNSFTSQKEVFSEMVTKYTKCSKKELEDWFY